MALNTMNGTSDTNAVARFAGSGVYENDCVPGAHAPGFTLFTRFAGLTQMSAVRELIKLPPRSSSLVD